MKLSKKKARLSVYAYLERGRIVAVARTRTELINSYHAPNAKPVKYWIGRDRSRRAAAAKAKTKATSTAAEPQPPGEAVRSEWLRMPVADGCYFRAVWVRGRWHVTGGPVFIEKTQDGELLAWEVGSHEKFVLAINDRVMYLKVTPPEPFANDKRDRRSL
jgi:hypothetical protein